MNMLRKLVSGERRRYQDLQYDLDITYITSRVIAMSYPGSGILEKTYRNPIEKVVRFLKERHGRKYWVFNCSERQYDKSPFDGQVSDFNWKDHHAPTLALLCSMVKAMYEFLQKDPDHVIAVHCNSGKGRTGTAIATLLLYTGFVQNIDDGLKYYGWKRFSSGKGVTQPCQLRSIYYFESAFNQQVIAPSPKKLKAMVVSTIPAMGQDGGCRSFIDITRSIDDSIIYTSRNLEGGPQIPYILPTEKAILFDFKDGQEPELVGDIHILLKHRGMMMDSLICRFAFNTAFLHPRQNNLTFKKSTVSPDSAKKDTRLSDDFMIQLVFEDYCSQCSKTKHTSSLDNFCPGCTQRFQKEIKNWHIIHSVMNNRPGKVAGLDGNHLHSQTGEADQTDKKDILALKLQFDPENYRIPSYHHIEESKKEETKEEDDGFLRTKTLVPDAQEQDKEDSFEVERLEPLPEEDPKVQEDSPK